MSCRRKVEWVGPIECLKMKCVVSRILSVLFIITIAISHMTCYGYITKDCFDYEAIIPDCSKNVVNTSLSMHVERIDWINDSFFNNILDISPTKSTSIEEEQDFFYILMNGTPESLYPSSFQINHFNMTNSVSQKIIQDSNFEMISLSNEFHSKLIYISQWKLHTDSSCMQISLMNWTTTTNVTYQNVSYFNEKKPHDCDDCSQRKEETVIYSDILYEWNVTLSLEESATVPVFFLNGTIYGYESTVLNGENSVEMNKIVYQTKKCNNLFGDLGNRDECFPVKMSCYSLQSNHETNSSNPMMISILFKSIQGSMKLFVYQYNPIINRPMLKSFYTFIPQVIDLEQKSYKSGFIQPFQSLDIQFIIFRLMKEEQVAFMNMHNLTMQEWEPFSTDYRYVMALFDDISGKIINIQQLPLPRNFFQTYSNLNIKDFKLLHSGNVNISEFLIQVDFCLIFTGNVHVKNVRGPTVFYYKLGSSVLIDKSQKIRLQWIFNGNVPTVNILFNVFVQGDWIPSEQNKVISSGNQIVPLDDNKLAVIGGIIDNIPERDPHHRHEMRADALILLIDMMDGTVKLWERFGDQRKDMIQLMRKLDDRGSLIFTHTVQGDFDPETPNYQQSVGIGEIGWNCFHRQDSWDELVRWVLKVTMFIIGGCTLVGVTVAMKLMFVVKCLQWRMKMSREEFTRLQS